VYALHTSVDGGFVPHQTQLIAADANTPRRNN
jgi:hypothetical protein